MKPSDKISRYFSYAETVATDHRKIDNTPPAGILPNIIATAKHMDRVRYLIGHPILVTSWYRCRLLNTTVGGDAKSAHMRGWAVDFIAPMRGPVPFLVGLIDASDIEFDQLIEEMPQSASGGWVHISFAHAMRGEVKTWDGKRYAIRIASERAVMRPPGLAARPLNARHS